MNFIGKLLFLITVSVLVLGCAGRQSSEQISLVGTSWELDSASFDMTGVEVMPVVLLGDSANLSGSAVCNSFFGEYYLSGDTLNLNVVGATMKLCENENLDTQFFDILGQTQFYETPQVDVLVLKDANMNVLGKFKKHENEKN